MLKWLTRSEEDYGNVLQQLEDELVGAEEALAVARSTSLALQAAVLKYGGALYAVYIVAFLLLDSVKPKPGDPAALWLAKLAVLALAPAAIYYTRVAVDVWYKAKIRSSSRKIETIRTTLKLKIEELKKKSGYYTTKNLLDKYETPQKPSRASPNTVQNTGTSTANTPNRVQTPTKPNAGGAAGTPKFHTPTSTIPFPSNQSIPTVNLQTPQKQVSSAITGIQTPNRSTPSSSSWFDRVMDAVVGDTEGPQNQYALICQSCFEHNGLAPPEQYSSIRFKCKSCGFLNVPHQYNSISRSNSVVDTARLPFSTTGSTTPLVRNQPSFDNGLLLPRPDSSLQSTRNPSPFDGSQIYDAATTVGTGQGPSHNELTFESDFEFRGRTRSRVEISGGGSGDFEFEQETEEVRPFEVQGGAGEDDDEGVLVEGTDNYDDVTAVRTAAADDAEGLRKRK
ncbi:hypothetical protein HK100_002025 [Physocladia obscura]|uniref:Endoplasmic reticulum junction formation protein lunapark n=1 Tax=Physocladia obscura TaxID=109957 RepID=A0AAD5SZ17_9FUNG|nr:hypothetical protein HK100_002025 [Physocladia obscura]